MATICQKAKPKIAHTFRDTAKYGQKISRLL